MMSHSKRAVRDGSRGRSRESLETFTGPGNQPCNPNFHATTYPVSTSTSPASTGSTTPTQYQSPYPTPQYQYSYHPQPHPPHPSITACPHHQSNPFNSMSGQTNSGQSTHGNASGSGSPTPGNKMFKTWRQMGDKTKSKTRDILKRWQTMNNGQASEDSLQGPDDLSDMSGSTESGVGSGGVYGRHSKSKKKNSWSVHVWSEYIYIYTHFLTCYFYF